MHRDEAARASWGSSWRIPTLDEERELENNCTREWITQNGVKGMKLTGPDGNSIFLPADGYYMNSILQQEGSYGSYWLNSLNIGVSFKARYMDLGPSEVFVDGCDCSDGQPVRPVSVRQK